MKIIQLASIAFAFCVALVGFARPASACLPVTGIFTAVQEQQFLNNAFFQLRGNNAGSSAPSDDCSGAPVKGQFWLNTSSAPNAFSIYDGSEQDVMGYVDPTNNLWLPVLGGGIATATAASVLDLCNGPPPTPQNEITISGSTPITSFGASCQVGQFKFLKFTGVPKIIYNAGSILTPSGQSFFAENGAHAIVVYQGAGVWEFFSYMAPASNVPPAAIQFTESTTPDAGYVLAYGQPVSTTACPNAFAKFGYLYGGSGAIFNMPDLRGRFLAGLDTQGGIGAAGNITSITQSIGQTGGAQSELVDKTHIANFSLNLSSSASVSDPGHQHSYTRAGAGAPISAPPGGANAVSLTGDLTGASTTGIGVSVSTSGSTGGSGVPLPTLPPTMMFAVEVRC